MRAKVSIRLPQVLLKAIDQHAQRQGTTRSGFIEAALRAFLRQPARAAQNARDLDIINRRADFLNREARDVLAYQTPYNRQSAEDSRTCFFEMRDE
jgi:Arc/MetJ-type ribon-helix-helix transcriptional regulator